MHAYICALELPLTPTINRIIPQEIPQGPLGEFGCDSECGGDRYNLRVLCDVVPSNNSEAGRYYRAFLSQSLSYLTQAHA